MQFTRPKANNKVVLTDALGHTLLIDCTVSEDHIFSAQATMHEIEGGGNISDHVVKKPFQLTLNGLISGDPYPESATVTIDGDATGPMAWTGERFQQIGFGALSGMAGSISSQIGGSVAGMAATYGVSKYSSSLLQTAAQAEARKTRENIAAKISDRGPSQIVKDAYDALVGIHEDKIPVAIITGLKEYKNMILESLALPRNKETVRSLPFTATFKQVNFVTSETVTIHAPAATDTQATMDRATAKQNQGTKQATEVEENSSPSSFFYKGAEKIGFIKDGKFNWPL